MLRHAARSGVRRWAGSTFPPAAIQTACIADATPSLRAFRPLDGLSALLEASVDPTPQQGGPIRTARALAIVHLAMYDAYVGVKGGPPYLSYTASENPGTTDTPAAQAAVAAAACLTLIDLFSRQKDTFLQQHQAFITMLNESDPKIARGLAWGSLVAAKMLAARKDDGSAASNDQYAPSAEPGRHRVDPLNPTQGYLGPLWGHVKPFGINNLNTAVPGMPPPALNSTQYATDFNAVKTLGTATGGTRTSAQTTIGVFWAYDGPRNIGVPPRLYNQIVRNIAAQHGTNEATNAKLFAMVNVAMADAGIQAWHEKYRYNVWRPVIGIREANAGWGPTGKGDGNPATVGDPYWLPLGAPRTNQPGKTAFTPPFPAYPSGHATFGTAALHVTQLLLGLPSTFSFEFVSDELNGESVDGDGSLRTKHRRTLTIAEAIEENILSRVYLGVHWEFDGREGEKNGRLIAEKINAAFPAFA